MKKSKGQEWYEECVRKTPLTVTGKTRPTWQELSEGTKRYWELAGINRKVGS